MRYSALLSLTALVPNVYSMALPAEAAAVSEIPPMPGMKLVWSDEFVGTAVDTKKWNIINGGGQNAEQQIYGPADCHVSGGSLKILPKKTNGKWTSCRLESLGHWAPTGGSVTYSAKIKLGTTPAGGNMKGVWPAFWTLGQSFRADGKWPASAEVDTMENINGDSTLHGTAHCLEGCNDNVAANQLLGRGKATPFDRAQFNVFSHTVTKDKITWSLNGKVYNTVTSTDVAGSWAAFQKDFYVILNVAMGGTWPGMTQDTTVQGAAAGMEVQWVAVYHS